MIASNGGGLTINQERQLRLLREKKERVGAALVERIGYLETLAREIKRYRAAQSSFTKEAHVERKASLEEIDRLLKLLGVE